MLSNIWNSITLCVNLGIAQIFGTINEKKTLNRIKKNIQNAGCIWIKFTQWYLEKIKLSLTEEEFEKYSIFSELYDQCNEHSLYYTKNIYRQEFNSELENDYNILSTPIASGSIGQVYQAIHIKTKKMVAIKVTHPNLQSEIKIPKFIITSFSYFIKTYEKFRKWIGVPFLLYDFIDELEKQFDLRNEGVNLLYYKYLNKDNKVIVIPDLLECKKNILIMSFEESKKLKHIKENNEFFKYKIAIGMCCLLKNSLLINNFIHNDLHEGNWGVRMDGKKIKIVIYDFALMFRGYTLEDNRCFHDCIESAGCKKKLTQLFMKLTENPEKVNAKDMENMLQIMSEKPMDIKKLVKVTVSYYLEKNLLMNSTLINIFILFLLVFDLFRKYNFLKKDINEIKKNINDTKSINLNNNTLDTNNVLINFCRTYSTFTELENYLTQKNKILIENIDKNNLNFSRSFNLQNKSDTLKLLNPLQYI